MKRNTLATLIMCSVFAGLSPAAFALEPGIMTRCYGLSDGKSWVVTDGDFSFESCKAKVIKCTGDANARVFYETPNPVLVQAPLKLCPAGLSAAETSAN